MDISDICIKLIETSHSPWHNFIPSAFHTVLFVIVSAIIKYNLREKLSWLVDVLACVLLLFGTFARMIILDGKTWSHDCFDALNSKDNIVLMYLIASIASWVAIIVLAAKSCLYILLQRCWESRVPRTFLEAVKISFLWGLGANSVISLGYFCSDVRKTFKNLTDEQLLIFYFNVAAALMVASALIQRIHFTSYTINYPLLTLEIPNINQEERKVMFRMTIVNIVDIFHVLGLMYFGLLHSNSKWTDEKLARCAFLCVEFVYKLYLCAWYFRNSCLYPQCRRLLADPQQALNQCVTYIQAVWIGALHLLQVLGLCLVRAVQRCVQWVVGTGLHLLRVALRRPDVTAGCENTHEESGPRLTATEENEMVATRTPNYRMRREIVMENGIADSAEITTNLLFRSSSADHRHLLPPHPSASCIQEARHRPTEEMVTGGCV